ncbi:preprotein translocase subunit YajC [Dactylosporangium sucinum]|uniref:Preprotein translocase subunit YajC n=1 Tax=Dactylosporangium sucinum TaxID=1424081 RepID=A0A917U231_9ACTN|nr:preprotein translocase subunit YajC [Dactylosporangium sucinum]GGM49574.1 preprotein translocase subunit YajC [Dactylosporangium sucinum]
MYHAEQASGGSSGFFTIILFAGFFVLIYFLMIRPQQKRRREVESMQSAMGIGDEVVTVGGLYGTVRGIEDDTVLLEIAPGVTAKYARAAIGKVTKKADAGDDEAADDDEAPADPARDAD